jgi:mRNA interferase RelE/StbE
MRYQIVIEKPAVKKLRTIPKNIQHQFTLQINALAENPYPNGSVKLEGFSNCFRIRQGDYRLIYAVIDDVLVVLVLRIAHRKEVYDSIKILKKQVEQYKTK